MKLDEIHEMWHSDSKIDSTKLDIESLTIPATTSKYLKILSSERLLKVKLETELIQLKTELYEFYTMGASKHHLEKGWGDKFPGNRILKGKESDMYIDSDNDIIQLSLKISYQREKIDLLDSIIKSLNNRSFHINNAINFLRWTHGG